MNNKQCSPVLYEPHRSCGTRYIRDYNPQLSSMVVFLTQLITRNNGYWKSYIMFNSNPASWGFFMDGATWYDTDPLNRTLWTEIRIGDDLDENPLSINVNNFYKNNVTFTYLFNCTHKCRLKLAKNQCINPYIASFMPHTRPHFYGIEKNMSVYQLRLCRD